MPEVGMFSRHPTRALSGYCDDELDAVEMREVAEHLLRCARCEREFEAIKYGVRLAKYGLRTTTIPSAEIWGKIELVLNGRASSDNQQPRGAYAYFGAISGQPRVIATAVAFVIMVLSLSWLFVWREPTVRITRASGIPTEYEQLARKIHLARAHANSGFDIQTPRADDLNHWINERTGMKAEFPARRSGADQADLVHFDGAVLASSGALKAVLVRYDVGGEPVSLLMAPIRRNLPAPPEGRFSKDIFYRSDEQSGLKFLSWSRSGQSYVLVSSLDNFGEAACFACHTSGKRRDLIRELNLDA